ncbi:unnamed protein product [Didymodactylos carnosus]|uniref:TBC1 domain family member 23 n=1 Tax=Didymodactylos carnosus TaxID=1234261 RepID=A0A813RFZ0_9BILA|nr:unnamed protein product [Didymodactylos carnosus]CAF0780404.1 unnamed protein product [Didymodactylos carnosus]CAF3493476.1 unnamed protein product [Didymodactylos carnosus]CAF3563525.1 unnamed protein product [Didymodactylos carnosus]
MCASLYDEDELDGKEISKTTVDQPQQPWGDSIRLLQAQLHTKKLQQQHQTKKELKGGGTVAPVADLRKRRMPRFGPGAEVSFNSMTGKMELHDPNLSENPLKPNDYEKLKEQKRRQQQRERDGEKRQHDEEERRLDFETEKEHNQEVEERSKKGATFAPPPSLIEEDKRSSIEASLHDVIPPYPSSKDRVEHMDTSPMSSTTFSNQTTLLPPSLPPPSSVNPFGASAAAKIMAKMGYKEGQGLGKSQQGMSQALVVEKTSKRGGKILHEKELPLKQDSIPPKTDSGVNMTDVMKNRSKVVLLRNMVGGGEVDELLEGETKEECQKYGEVEKVVIFEIPDSVDEEAVRIFIEFKRVESAVKEIMVTVQPFSMDDDDNTVHLDDDDFNDDIEISRQNDGYTSLKNNDWINELRQALDRGCDLGSIRNIGKCRPLNNELRLRVWQTCLDINSNSDKYKYINEVFDLPEQNIIREDVLRLVQSLNSDDPDAASKISDVEAVITAYCKQYKETYERSNGWIELFKPLLVVEYSDRSELYELFVAILNRYIPRDCETDGMPYHLFRLLLLYHDPELCSFLDTKKVTPDLYAHAWIRSLFAANCSLDVTLDLWDGYFQQADQFFAFFLALVLLMFAKEHLFKMSGADKSEIIKFLSQAASNLSANDLEDFCSLANHYASNTPQSFRKEFYSCLFNDSDRTFSQKACSIYQALCLPVSVQELLQANQLGGATAGVRYFVVDCRPADHYNYRHLYTAFHLDPNLLLEDPKEFSGTVDALFATQKHSIEADSSAGGEHLCFMGSGHEEEDKYVRMVVAHFLQRNTKYVSIAHGGYKMLARVIEDPSMLTHAQQNNSTSNESSISDSNINAWLNSVHKQNSIEKLAVLNNQTISLINIISSAVKTKSIEVKDKVKDYIAHTSLADDQTLKHVSKKDKTDNIYRQKNQSSVFTIDGDDENDTPSTRQKEPPELVDIESWFLRSDMLYKYECQYIDENNQMHPSLLLVSSSHLYILRKLRDHKTMADVISRRPLQSIVKITSKKKFPEIITFRYSTQQQQQDSTMTTPSLSSSLQNPIIVDCDKVFLPDAGDATKNIKFLIVKALNLYDFNDKEEQQTSTNQSLTTA